MNSVLERFRKDIADKAFVRASSQTPIVSQSGERFSRWLFDFRALLLSPQWIDTYAELFWERYAQQYPFQVAGMETSGIPLVTAIVMKSVQRGMPVNGFFLRKSRKKTGLMKFVEGTPNGEKVILVDDLINSGQTLDKERVILTDHGLTVSDMFVILSFRERSAYTSFNEKNVALSCLFTLKDFDLPLHATKSDLVPRDDFEVVWRYHAPVPSHHLVVPKSAPVSDGQRIYFGCTDGIFRAINASNGTLAWDFKTGRHAKGKGILSSPYLHDGILYFGSYDGNVYALDAATGRERWRYSDADWVGSSPTISPRDNMLFVGLEFGLFQKQGGLAALSLADGALLWQHTFPEFVHSSPLFIPEEDLVVIGCNDNTVRAFSSRGVARWTMRTFGAHKASFSYDAKRRYLVFGCMGGGMYAVYAPTGSLVFSRSADAGIYSTPLLIGNTMYVAALDKKIYALNLDTERYEWVVETSGRIFASPVSFRGSLWCGSNDGRLYRISPRSGKVESFFQTSERIVNKVICDENTGHLYVPTHANELYKLSIRHENAPAT